MIIAFVLLFFSLAIQASEPELLIPANSAGFFINNSQTCWLELNHDGDYNCRSAKEETPEMMPKDGIVSEQTFLKQIPEYCNLSKDSRHNRSQRYFCALPTSLLEKFLLVGPRWNSPISTCLPDGQGNKSVFYMKLPPLLKQCYRNDQNQICYYITYKGQVRWVDLLPLSKEYAHFFQPIKNIVKVSTTLVTPGGLMCPNFKERCFALLTIWKNVFIFLKNYFYNAYGKRRLQNSLREVFLSNAGVVLQPLICFYYLGLLFLAFQPNLRFGLILIRLIAGVHPNPNFKEILMAGVHLNPSFGETLIRLTAGIHFISHIVLNFVKFSL